MGLRENIKTLNSWDVWLMADFDKVCAALVADDPRHVEDFPDAIIEFLENPYVPTLLRERLIKKDKGAGERLLKSIIEDRPENINVHQLLVELYEKECRFSEVEAEYKRILSEIDDEVVWANYGFFLERKGAYEEALDAYKRSFEKYQSNETMKGFFEEVKISISRVERMKKLEGEERRKVREYMEATWLIDDISEYARNAMEREKENAREEYIEEKNKDELEKEDVFDFLNWFLFHRKLPDGGHQGWYMPMRKTFARKRKRR